MEHLVTRKKGIFKYLYLIFTGGGLFLIWALNIIFFLDNPGFIAVSPHPYILVVVVVAAIYGYTRAMISALLVSLVYLTSLLFHLLIYEQNISRFFQYSYFKPFISFAVLGTVIGMIVDRLIKRMSQAQSMLKEYNVRIEQLHEEIKIIQIKSHEQKEKLANFKNFITLLFDLAKKICTLNLENLYPAILDMLQEMIEAEQGALFIKQGAKLTVGASFGYKAKEQPKISQDLIELVLREKRVISLKDILAKDKKRKKEVFLCGPLYLAESGDNIGVLLLQKLPFYKYNPLSLRIFTLICEWASLCIDNALQYRAAQQLAGRKNKEVPPLNIIDSLIQKYQGMYQFGTTLEKITRNLEKKLKEEI